MEWAEMGTILIIDDILADRNILATLLRHQGHRVLGANGREGLAAVQAEHVDLVIDMTGCTDDATVHRRVLNPGLARLHEPFTADTLGRRVREAFDQ